MESTIGNTVYQNYFRSFILCCERFKNAARDGENKSNLCNSAIWKNWSIQLQPVSWKHRLWRSWLCRFFYSFQLYMKLIVLFFLRLSTHYIQKLETNDMVDWWRYLMSVVEMFVTWNQIVTNIDKFFSVRTSSEDEIAVDFSVIRFYQSTEWL